MKKILLFRIIIIAIISGILFYISALENTKNIERQNAYALTEPPLIDFVKLSTVKDLVQDSHLVIQAEVSGSSGKIESIPVIDPDTPEGAIYKKAVENGNKPRGMQFEQVKLIVNEVLLGDKALKEITLVQPEISEGFEPKLLKGDKVLLFLRKISVNDLKDTYIAIHPHASYIFINQGNKVNPICKEGEFSSLGGVTLDKTKELIIAAIQELKTVQ